jgi:hypothetical protein
MMTAMLANMLHNRVQRRAVNLAEFLQALKESNEWSTALRMG